MSGFGGFAAPQGSRLHRYLGRGELLEAALVEHGDRLLVAKRSCRGREHEPAAAEALVREARALALVALPGLPELVAVGTDEHGSFLLETEVAGLSLAQLGEAWCGQVPALLNRHLAVRATRLVSALHAARSLDGSSLEFVHGDLAPTHLLVAPHGELGLIDFGSSRSAQHLGPKGARGTLPYVAPELARGEVEPSQATDRYALAVLVAELLLGARLLPMPPGPSMLLSIGERGHPVAALDTAELDSPLEDALRAQLSFDPADRPHDLGGLLIALDSLGG
jgi:eukaryotic-like serine/threonine-protein kinase